MKYLLSAIALLTCVNTFATPYSLEDYNVDAYLTRTVDTGFGFGRIYGYGLENSFQVHTGNSDEKQYSNVFKLDVDKDKFTIDFLNNSGWVDGIVFRLEQPDYATTTGEDFWYNIAAETNIEGLAISSGLGWVELNFSKLRFNQDSFFVGRLNYKEVPEPASYLLLLIGLFFVYLKATRRPQRQSI